MQAGTHTPCRGTFRSVAPVIAQLVQSGHFRAGGALYALSALRAVPLVLPTLSASCALLDGLPKTPGLQIAWSAKRGSTKTPQA